ncbi:MAG TPA: hypothetical protein VFQ11_11515 [Nocardioidaceae bacterium]|nr:hypothetical protein [Nocardioidaceae bacterium]
MPRTDRREFLLLGAGLLLAGCTSSPEPRPSPRHSSSPSVPRPSTPGGGPTATPSAPPLPPVSPWRPDPADLSPRAKATAVRAIERRDADRGSVVQVLEAQYGGLLADTVSVLVVTRSWHRRGRAVVSGGATYDVRLSRTTAGWRVTAVHPSHPGAPHRSTDEERRVLGSGRIDLPPAARADVRSGRVHVSVLTALLRLSERYRVGVSVVRSGHPLHVFGTDRLSDHPQGRAFDTFRVDGHLVVSRDTPRRLVTGYMEAAAAAGSYNVGGPYLLGQGPQWFSDATHHDHVHAGFTG